MTIHKDFCFMNGNMYQNLELTWVNPTLVEDTQRTAG